MSLAKRAIRARKQKSLIGQVRYDLGLWHHRPYGYVNATQRWVKRNPWHRRFKIEGWKFPRNPLGWFSHKRFVLGIVLLAILAGGFLVAKDSWLFHSYHPNPFALDPSTVIWDAAGNDASLNDWATGGIGADFCNNCYGDGFTYYRLTPNATTTAILLSRASADFSPATGKTIEFLTRFMVNTFTAKFGVSWGWFLTTNYTKIPTFSLANSGLPYDPITDPNVLALMKVQCNEVTDCATNGAHAYIASTYMLRSPGSGTTMSKENTGTFSTSGSGFMATTQSLTLTNARTEMLQDWNYTGVSNAGGCGGTPIIQGPGCSNLGLIPCCGNQVGTSSQVLPWANIFAQKLAIGIFAQGGLGTGATVGFMANNAMFTQTYSAFVSTSQSQPTLDTGGPFGPIIAALVNIGVFILRAILGFIAFIAPALIAALQFLESIVKQALNAVGTVFGFPSSPGLGDDIFTFIAQLITLFTVQVPNAFGQIGNIFTGWVNVLTVVFTTGIIGQIFSFLSSILTFAINIVSFAFGVFTTGLNWTTIFVPFWLFVFFLGFNADEGVNGWIRWYEFAKWVAFDIGVKTVTWLLNWTIDVITAAMAILPKPLVNIAGKFPRIPVLDIHGTFSFPDFNGASLREGNLFSILGMLFGFIGFVWYELTQTGIPGTLANEFPTQAWVTTASTAITFYKLFLPMAVLVVFLLMIPTLFTSVFGVRVQGLPSVPISFKTGRGRRPPLTTGFGGGFRGLIRQPKKHLQGRLERKIEEQKTERLKGEQFARNLREREVQLQAEAEKAIAEQTKTRLAKEESQRQAFAKKRMMEMQREQAREELGRTAEGFE